MKFYDFTKDDNAIEKHLDRIATSLENLEIIILGMTNKGPQHPYPAQRDAS